MNFLDTCDSASPNVGFIMTLIAAHFKGLSSGFNSHARLQHVPTSIVVSYLLKYSTYIFFLLT